MECPEEPGVCSESPPAALTEHQLRLVLDERGTPAEIAARTGLTAHEVRIALEYWDRNPEAI